MPFCKDGGFDYSDIREPHGYFELLNRIALHPTPYTAWMPDDYDCGALVADAFVEGLAATHILITDAYYDYAVDASRYPDVLMEWSGMQAESVFEDAALRFDLDPGTERPGRMEVVFTETPEYTPPGAEPGAVRRIRMPEYRDAGHMVTRYQAEAFWADVRDFLLESGLDEGTAGAASPR